jgi:hypothetical protein
VPGQREEVWRQEVGGGSGAGLESAAATRGFLVN